MMEARVAVITRTKNRPMFLPRALRSVAAQRFKDFVWIVVNDAGEKEYVDAVAEQARQSGVRTLVVHREKSCGMEAASNDGIQKCRSDYIVIHDDDDTWDNGFLEETVSFLDENPEKTGVVVHSKRIDERVALDGISIISELPFNTFLDAIHLADMFLYNTFPPISFLFRRSVWEGVGGFDEFWQVFGDWDFNLKVLGRGDIGLIPKMLANYHFREAGTNGANSNAVAGEERMATYETVFRNRHIRNYMRGDNPIGFFVGLGRMQIVQLKRIMSKIK